MSGERLWRTGRRPPEPNGLSVYRCQQCDAVVPAGTPRHLVVIETRAVIYPPRKGAHRIKRRTGDPGSGPYRYIDDEGGRGREIVRTQIVCPDCSAQRGPVVLKQAG